MPTDRITWESPPLPEWAQAILGEDPTQRAARRVYGEFPPDQGPRASAAETLAAVDATVEGRCVGPGCGIPLTADSPSGWWCSPDCQMAYHRQGTIRPGEVRGSTRVAADPARWRPDLVDAVAEEDLELVAEVPHGDRFTARWYRRPSGCLHLRLDDGHRFVGADAGDDALAQAELLNRLERELTDPRRLDPEPGTPDGVGLLGEGVVPPTGLSAERVRATICEWLRANGIDPDEVPEDAQIEVRDGMIHCEVVRREPGSGDLIRDGHTVARARIAVRHRCRLPWPGTGPCPICVDRCEPGCGCTCWGISTEEASAASVELDRRIQEAIETQEGERAVLAGQPDPRAQGLFWMANPPADPEAPTLAELAGAVDLTPYLVPVAQPTGTGQVRVNLRVDTCQAEEVAGRAFDTLRRVGEHLLGAGSPVAGAIAAYQNLPEATRAAVEAEQNRLTLRALCSDEAEYERALQAARDHGLTVCEVAEMLAAGRAPGPEGFSASALDHLMDAGAIDAAGIRTTVPPPPTGEDIMANIRAFSEQLANHNPAVRFDAGTAVIEALRAQAPRSRTPGGPLGGLGDVPVIPDPTLAPEEWRLEYADGQRLESHVCVFELIERASWDWTRPWRRVSRCRCSLRWSDGTRCDSTTTDPSTMRRTERLVGPSTTGGGAS